MISRMISPIAFLISTRRVTSSLDLSLPTSHSGLLAWYAFGGAIASTTASLSRNPVLTSVNWAATNCVVTGSEPDHLGGNTGYKISENSLTAGQRYIRGSGGGAAYSGEMVYELWSKRDATVRDIYAGVNTNTGATINLATLGITKAAGHIADVLVEDAGNGWDRIRSVASSTTSWDAFIALSYNGTSSASYTPASLGGVYISTAGASPCTQTRVITLADQSPAGAHAIRPAGSEVLQPLFWNGLSVPGKWVGSRAAVVKSVALPSSVYTALNGSFTIGMRVWIQDVTAGTHEWLDTISTTPQLRLQRNAATLAITRTQDNGTTASVTIATGLTVGVHTIFLTFDASTGTVSGITDKGTPVTGTLPTGAMTLATMTLAYKGWAGTDIAIWNRALSKTDCDALADGFETRKGT